MQSSAVDLIALIGTVASAVLVLALLVTGLAVLIRRWRSSSDGAPRSTPFTTTRSGDHTNRSM